MLLTFFFYFIVLTLSFIPEHFKTITRNITHILIRLQNKLLNDLFANSTSKMVMMIANFKFYRFLLQMFCFWRFLIRQFPWTKNENIHLFISWFIDTLISWPILMQYLFWSFINTWYFCWTIFETFIKI